MDSRIFLGGAEPTTLKELNQSLGKETIDLNTYGRSKGRNGNYSTNWQLSGRELMTPDEVRMLDNKYALLFLRGERPVQDLKYDITKHPNVALTADGGATPYTHGEDTRSVATIQFDETMPSQTEDLDLTGIEYELLTEEELEEQFTKTEE